MSFDVAGILKRRGPSLTSEVIDELKTAGLSDAAARQRVTRAQFEYTRLAGLRFTKNARFIYLPEQYGTEAYWLGLERAFQQCGRAYWCAYVGLRARGGMCPKSLFPVVCGAPSARARQLSPARILERLSAIQLMKEVEAPGAQEPYIAFVPYRYRGRTIDEVRATLLAEDVVLHGAREWARRIGFGSYGKFRIRGDDETPLVSGIAWDLSAPSYARPLASVQSGVAKPGFIVADAILNGVVDRNTVEVFIRKHDLASAPLKVQPIMPFLIGDIFAEEAFTLAKQKGILAVTTETLFGVDVAKALRSLIQLLTDAGAAAAVNPEYLAGVLNALTRIEGAAANIRGALFELVVGSLVKDVETGFLETGPTWTDWGTGQTVEIDVLLNRPGPKPLVIECKAKTPGAAVSRAEVEHWLSNRVPLIKKIMDENPHYDDVEVRFELWSNGPFHPAALAWLNEQPKEYEGYSFGWRDGEAMKKYADKAKSASIRKTLNEHYFKHPLVKLVMAAAKGKTGVTAS